jgi:Flp pilus assembly protein TadB
MFRNLEPMFSNPGGADPRVLILMVAILLSIVGFAWIRSITSIEEDGPSSWRYLRNTDDAEALVEAFIRDSHVAQASTEPPDIKTRIDDLFAKSWRRARRGRATARLMLAAAILAVAFIILIVLAAPNYMYTPEPKPPDVFMLGIPVLGFVIGLAWMWRILRADPEPDSEAWRYRER